MFIKQIELSGFKTYRQKTIVEEFDRRHNSIVGRNGSGKSNFFLAIRFVLADEFTDTRKEEERQQYLHQGAGDRVLSAYVRITFDNSDGRLPFDKDEVVIQRSVGNKKDEFFIDRNRSSKSEIINILESAGFSRSNPYYIVQQGKVHTLAGMKDSQRLDLLTEVAGSKVYDEKRAESITLMKTAKNSLASTSKNLDHIDQRLADLEDEMNELKEYEVWDRKRRCIEYALYKKDLDEAKDKLEEIQTQRGDDSNRLAELRAKVEVVQEHLQELEEKLTGVRATNSQYLSAKQNAEQERQECMASQLRLQLEIKERETLLNSQLTLKQGTTSAMQSVQESIRTTRIQFEAIKEQFNEALEDERQIQTQLEVAKAQRSALYEKAGRSQQFSSKSERDVWIKSQIAEIDEQIETQQVGIQHTQQTIQENTRLASQLRDSVKNEEEAVQSMRNKLSQVSEEYNAKYRLRNEVQDNQKELFMEEKKLEEEINFLRNELTSSENALKGSIGKVTFNGLAEVRRLVDEHQISGYHGALIDLIEMEETYIAAIEATAGNKLFNVVVDTKDTAQQLIRLLQNTNSGGRLTFIPLEQIRSRPLDLPTTDDSFPLMQVIEYDDYIEPAVNAIFGKIMVVRNFDVAEEIYSQPGNQLDCVTIDGDKMSRKGYIAGGYRDPGQSKIALSDACAGYQERITSTMALSIDVKKELARVDQTNTKTNGEIENLGSTRKRIKFQIEGAEMKHSALIKELKQVQETLESDEIKQRDLQSSLQMFESKRELLAAELKTKMTSKLSGKDSSALQQLTQEIEGMTAQWNTLRTKRVQLEGEKNALSGTLDRNLYLRQAELNATVNDLNLSDTEFQLQRNKEELARVETNLEKQERKLKDLQVGLDNASEEEQMLLEELETKKSEEKEINTVLAKENKTVDSLLNNRNLWTRTRDENERKIRDLGLLPVEHDEYELKKKRELKGLLRQTNEQLKKYAHVNKKALNQYINFTDERKELVQRKETTIKEAKAINKLIEALDEQKDEAIIRTFAGVAKNFQEVFSELVPHGHAKLVIQTTEDQEDNDQDEDEDDNDDGMDIDENNSGNQASSGKRSKGPKSGTVDRFTGIRVEAVFQEGAQAVDMSLLSGGQRSLVALALIFAIQRLDAAPFYLFDEVDAALDPTHRRAVADMISRLADDGTQFISTTFNPEFVKVANKHYGVTSVNKESLVDVIEMEQALDLIEENNDGNDLNISGSSSSSSASMTLDDSMEYE